MGLPTGQSDLNLIASLEYCIVQPSHKQLGFKESIDGLYPAHLGQALMIIWRHQLFRGDFHVNLDILQLVTNGTDTAQLHCVYL